MKKTIVACFLVLMIIGSAFAANSYDIEKVIGANIQLGTYKVNVTREKQDMYKINNISGDAYILTRYCHEHCYNQDVILEITHVSGSYNIGKIYF